MPNIRVIKDIDKPGSSFVAPSPDKIVHVPDAEIIIGTLEAGMQSGKTSLVIVIPLPDGKTMIAETSLAVFRAAHAALSGIE